MAYTRNPYTRKVWVNVPNATELTKEELNALIPENAEGIKQDALARFDGDNMNRIEDGIEEALGAVDKLTDIQSNLKAHTDDKSNPHGVKLSQVGGGTISLGLVPLILNNKEDGNGEGAFLGFEKKGESLGSIGILNGRAQVHMNAEHYDIYHSGYKPTAADVGEGVFPSTYIKAKAGMDYTTARLRNASLNSVETTPTENGAIAWTYK